MATKVTWLLLGLAALSCVCAALGDEPPVVEPSCASPGGLPPVACYAQPSDDGHYIGYYVGGGAACRGSGRCPDEGTWGWDYGGLLFPHRIVLQWYHGLRYQGGKGAYKVDGPPVPDVPAFLASPHSNKQSAVSSEPPSGLSRRGND